MLVHSTIQLDWILQEVMTVGDIKASFHDSTRNAGRRDCKVMATSALNGYVN